ncbi:hypothetical protein D3C71_1582610 [compost metagenome]
MVVIGSDDQIDLHGRVSAGDQAGSFRDIVDHGPARQVVLPSGRQSVRCILLVLAYCDHKPLGRSRRRILAHAAHHQRVAEPE